MGNKHILKLRFHVEGDGELPKHFRHRNAMIRFGFQMTFDSCAGDKFMMVMGEMRANKQMRLYRPSANKQLFVTNVKYFVTVEHGKNRIKNV